ncbi:Oidioi.mRNA.OKI2018_I69.chr1.g2683.t2.cds [Oikopleura dioica]|uniref:Anoctamin n=1 Tax=Oikopleura dioica TaxID=34765 RepID=A0ABN7SRV4_OIKDI|nr:Oidioi.mRNA.OKI2018_I69.chr1.g2683.t2.cds [Oikopleura dioica]
MRNSIIPEEDEAPEKSAADIQSSEPSQERDETLFLKSSEDGIKKKIDFIIMYNFSADPESRNHHESLRRTLKQRLRSKNLIVEDASEDENFEPRTDEEGNIDEKQKYFIKIHAPMVVLKKQAEVLSINCRLQSRKDIKAMIASQVQERIEGGVLEGDSDDEDDEDNDEDSGCLENFFSKTKETWSNFIEKSEGFFQVKEIWDTDPEDYFTAIYRHDLHDYFAKTENEEEFFTDSQRIRMVANILNNIKWEGKNSRKIGIRAFLENEEGAILGYYPLHDGVFNEPQISDEEDFVPKKSLRAYLHRNWSGWKNFYRSQPLDEIRDYFGEKIALYFGFLGFYTNSLIAFSVIGLIVMIYGLATFQTDTVITETCNMTDVILCPKCFDCTFDKASDLCQPLKITYIFDNVFTLGYAFLVSIWAMTFLELWARKNFFLEYEWDLTKIDKDMEPPRARYQAVAPQNRLNPVTFKKEAYIPLSTIYPRKLLSLSVVLFFILLVIASVVAVIVYRMVLSVIVNDLGFAEDSPVGEVVTPSIVVTTTASTISLILIMGFNLIYHKAAAKLTELEVPRTQQEFDDSYSFKIFCFQFVNYYSNLFYIAFFKDTLVGYPTNYLSIKGSDGKEYRWAGCDGGCSYELAIQLIITMVGKQLINNVIEILLPAFQKWWTRKKNEDNLGLNIDARWKADSLLSSSNEIKYGFDVNYLNDYIELAIQFGFAVLFSCAFPLAPLFAFLNNIAEIRIDAAKYVKYSQRPIPERTKNIGIWEPIFRFLAILAVITNGLQLAITSQTVPRIVYAAMGKSENEDLPLAGFARSIYSVYQIPDDFVGGNPENYTECHYEGYRDENLEPTIDYWSDRYARVLFFILYEHAVFLTVWLIVWLIPNKPQSLKNMIKQEEYIVQTILKDKAKKDLSKKNS